MQFQGSCHCGQVKFEVQGELKQVLACNCSICSRKGSLLWFVPRENFELMSSEKDRCLEGVDVDKLPAQRFDGRSL